MLAILNSLNAHNLPIFQPILMILASKLIIHRALSDKTYLFLGLPSPSILKSADYKNHAKLPRMQRFEKYKQFDLGLYCLPIL